MTNDLTFRLTFFSILLSQEEKAINTDLEINVLTRGVCLVRKKIIKGYFVNL